jgi:hypothetical protein
MTEIRERIASIQAQLKDGALTPDMARESLVQLTALYGNVIEEARDSDLAYKRVLLTALQSNEKANRARIEAECSPEYARAREARDYERFTIEQIRSLKKYMASLEEEMRLSRG